MGTSTRGRKERIPKWTQTTKHYGIEWKETRDDGAYWETSI